MSPEQWAAAFASQAKSDWEAYNALYLHAGLADCHRLHLLQMACKKVCKSYEYGAGRASARTGASHIVIRDNFPLISRVFYQGAFGKRLSRYSPLLDQIKRLSREVELLAPAADDDSRRPDNCEYLWKDAEGEVLVPASYSFTTLTLLTRPAGRELLKVLPVAIDELLT